MTSRLSKTYNGDIYVNSPGGITQKLQTQIAYNVLDYGFDPTGVVACDTLAATLATLVNSASNGGSCTVYFPTGTYLFHNPMPIFSDRTKFTGNEQNRATLNYDGYGTFWTVPNTSRIEYLSIISTYTSAASAAPSKANFITVATNATPIEITTATAHGYLTGDKIGIYGVTGNTAANCDPANPWTITKIDSTHYTLNGSVGNGVYAPVTTTVNGATNVSPIVISTTTASGAVNGQLVYITGVLGNTAANGLFRLVGAGASTTTFPIAVNLITTPSVGNGNYTSGGTVYTGGVCLEYSGIAMIGLYIEGANIGNVQVDSCLIGGFKYGIVVDGGELVWIERCIIQGAEAEGSGLGYSNDGANNDSTHSAFGIYLGNQGSGFEAYSNLIEIKGCNFGATTYCGIYHHDGTSHVVRSCNWECPVIAILSNANTVSYDGIQNDGSLDMVGLFQSRSDTSGCNNYCLSIRNALIGANYCPIVGIQTVGDLIGCLIENVFWGSSIPVALVQIPQLTLRGVIGNGSPLGTNQLFSLPNADSNQDIHNGGTTINHYSASLGALDIGFYPYAGTSPVPFPAIIVRDPITSAVFYQKAWSPLSGETYGSAIDVTSVVTGTSTTAACRAEGLGMTALVGGSGANIGTTPLPINTYTAGSILMQVSALDTTTGFIARWSIRQLFAGNGSAATLGIVIESDIIDQIGLTVPIMVLSGSAGAQSVSATLYGTGSDSIYFSVIFDLDGVGL